MFDTFSALLRDEDGATLVEYSLVVALIAGVCIGIIGALGTSVGGLFTAITTKITGATTGMK